MNELITKIADRMVYGTDTDWAMNIDSFDWVPGVGLFGIWKAYKKTGNINYLDFLVKWADKHMGEAYEKKTVNSTAPLLTICEVYKETKNPKYLTVCKDIAEYIITEAPLTREGGLEHTVTEAGGGFSEQIWADTLFMVCIFLAKLSIVTGNERYKEFAVNQLKIHHKLLFDQNAGLYYHGWNCAAQNHMSGVFWGRANAWIIYSSMEILRTLGDFDGADDIKAYIKCHAEALKTLQRDSGAFGTILNDETAYDEISATAGITAGIKMAMSEKILDQTYDEIAIKGLDAVCSAVLDNGEVDKVSTGTPVMPSAEDYKTIPIVPTLYGQGLALLALCL